jgi:hypothetical protein
MSYIYWGPNIPFVHVEDLVVYRWQLSKQQNKQLNNTTKGSRSWEAKISSTIKEISHLSWN